jgi:hypothetical protein
MVVTQLARSVVAHFGMCLAKGRRRDTPYQAGRVWCVCVWKNTLACALSKADEDTLPIKQSVPGVCVCVEKHSGMCLVKARQ